MLDGLRGIRRADSIRAGQMAASRRVNRSVHFHSCGVRAVQRCQCPLEPSSDAEHEAWGPCPLAARPGVACGGAELPIER